MPRGGSTECDDFRGVGAGFGVLLMWSSVESSRCISLLYVGDVRVGLEVCVSAEVMVVVRIEGDEEEREII